MRTIHRIDSSYPIDDLIPFCKEAENDHRSGAENMVYHDWENKPHTFLYLLYKEKRFDGPDNGYLICKENNKIVCGNGFYLSEIDKMMCTAVRTYTVFGENCAHNQGDFNDIICDVARKVGARGIFFSVNEYNKRYLEGYAKINNPKNHPNSYRDETGQWWAKQGRRIYPNSSYGPIRLKETKQWIVYHLLDMSEQELLLEELRKFDWNEES